MNLTEIINRNYKATIKRGLITSNTTFTDFKFKLLEELNEWIVSPGDKLECADVVLVMFAYCKHNGIDIQKALEEKTIINENRKD